MSFRSRLTRTTLTGLAGIALAWALLGGTGGLFERRPTGQPQLVAIETGANSEAFSTYAQERSESDILPRRIIHDGMPTFSAVAVDPVRDEIAVQDENLFQILVYNRLDHTPPQADMTEPKRVIGGLETHVEFNCGLYIDPHSGDIYSVNNDTVDKMVIFSRDAEGNVPPDRYLETPHGTYGIAVDEENQELFLTVQHDSAVVVYNKMATKDQIPLRLLQGDDTELADPHGIALDNKNGLIFVSNHGSRHKVREEAKTEDPTFLREPRENYPLNRTYAARGSGVLTEPSITVYRRTAKGNEKPVRTIQGPRTRLNWPSGIAVESDRGELFVANDTDHSILVFQVTDQGDVAPTRVLQGPQTLIKNPTNLTLDAVNQELWVSSFGNHSVSAFPIDADGNTPPRRTIRAAPLGRKALGIGNPGGVAYDSKRKEILVPN